MKIGDLVKWTIPRELTAMEYWASCSYVNCPVYWASHEWKVRYWNSHDNWTRPRYGIIIKFWDSRNAGWFHSIHGDDPIISWFNGETYGTYRGDVEVISGEEK